MRCLSPFSSAQLRGRQYTRGGDPLVKADSGWILHIATHEGGVVNYRPVPSLYPLEPNRSPIMAEPLTRRHFLRDGTLAAGAAAVAPCAGEHDCRGEPRQGRYEQNRQLQCRDGIPPLRQDGDDDLRGVYGRALEADDTMVPNISKGNAWGMVDLDNPEFQKNRAAVVSRCIDRGMNYIDACTGGEVGWPTPTHFEAGARNAPGLFLGGRRGPQPGVPHLRQTQADDGAGLEAGGIGIRRSVAGHVPGAEQPARPAPRSRN